MKTKKPKVTGSDGKRRHPLLELSKHISQSELGRRLGHSNHSSVAIYLRKAKKDGSTLVPIDWVKPLCRISGFQPAVWRPDVFEAGWEYPPPAERVYKRRVRSKLAEVLSQEGAP